MVRRPGFRSGVLPESSVAQVRLAAAMEDRYLECFDVLAGSYLAGVTWEPRGEIEARSARLLPGLLLGRVDGKSPVEYLTRGGSRPRPPRGTRAAPRPC